MPVQTLSLPDAQKRINRFLDNIIKRGASKTICGLSVRWDLYAKTEGGYREWTFSVSTDYHGGHAVAMVKMNDPRLGKVGYCGHGMVYKIAADDEGGELFLSEWSNEACEVLKSITGREATEVRTVPGNVTRLLPVTVAYRGGAELLGVLA